MTRSDSTTVALGVSYVAIVAIAQIFELQSDFAMRWIAGLFPGVFG